MISNARLPVAGPAIRSFALDHRVAAASRYEARMRRGLVPNGMHELFPLTAGNLLAAEESSEGACKVKRDK
jgi:hypothetical protein